MADHEGALAEAGLRVRRAARATNACLLAAALVAIAALATYLHGWRAGWPTATILCVVIPATLALSVLSVAFDGILKARLRAEMALLDLSLAELFPEAGGGGTEGRRAASS